MKITHIIYDSINNPWLGGGGAQRTHEIYKRLSTYNDITVITGNFNDAKNNIDGVRYLRLGLGTNYIISRISFLILIIIYNPFIKSDILIEDLGFPFPLVITTFRKKIIASVQFIPNESYVQKRGLLGKIVKYIFKLGIKTYKNFITVSPFAASYIKSNNTKSKIKIIPNGVNLPKISTNKYSNKYILFLGRIDYFGKGLDTLLEAFSILKLKDIKVNLKIAGSGEDKEVLKVKKQIKELHLEKNIELIGPVIDNKKDDVINNANFLVLPSRNETFGIVAIEAFSYEKPVIGTNIGGLKKILEDSKAAVVIKPGDAKQLAIEIENLTFNSNIVKKLGKNGRKYAEKYTWDMIAKQYIGALKKFYE